MEITSAVGPVLGLASILITAKLKHLELTALLNAPGSTIVFLGTIAAVTTAYPLKDMKHGFKSLGVYLNGPHHDNAALLGDIERLAQLARKDGFLALEKEIEKLEDKFLAKGIRMLVDNTEPPVIQEVMENEIAILYEEEEVAVKFWEDIGAFAPTIGILGAVLGLMMVMANLKNPDAIGPGIAAAFTATIYGVALANLIALPIAKKLKRFCHHNKMFREMAFIGVMGIAGGQNPKVLIERLRGMAGEESAAEH